MRKSPPAKRMRSRPENPCSKTVNSGSVRPMTQAMPSSRMRRGMSARMMPRRRARGCWSFGSLPTSTAMNTILSMPSTISSAVSVSRLSQISGFANQSMTLPRAATDPAGPCPICLGPATAAMACANEMDYHLTPDARRARRSSWVQLDKGRLRFMRGIRFFALLLGAALAIPLSATATDLALATFPPVGKLDYRVTRQGDDIGTQTVEFIRDGDHLTVRTHVDISVATLGITLFHFTHEAEEQWQGGRLTRITSRTDDDGQPRQVDLRLDGDRLRGTY